ncbi:MAG TPA: CBS domain-containing protein [Candidatus Aquicultor sp.]|jgi:CBS domain-containing protein/sporulation protein YlmC with PRC-barrel domain
MATNPAVERVRSGRAYFLTELLGAKVLLNGKKVGKLKDIVIKETGKIPVVTHLYVSRPFGDPALLIPWDKVKSINPREIVVDIEDKKQYEAEPPEGSVLLKDHILDKKVLDIEGREIDVAYDIKLVMRNGNLYVTKVDFSRHGLLRRMHLKWLSDFIYNLSVKAKGETVSWAYIEPLPTEIDSFRGNLQLKVLQEKLSDMPPVDLADIIEELDHDQRIAIFNQLNTEQASDALEEIDPNVQRALISSLGTDKAAELVGEMTVGQAADVLAVLSSAGATAILNLLDKDEAIKIKAILERQEEHILNFATPDFVWYPPDKTVEQAQEEYHIVAKGKDVVMYIYIVNERNQLLGLLDVKELLQADDKALLKDVMIDNVVSLRPESTLKEASEMFERYEFRAIPVLDGSDRILGVIPYRDIMNLKHRFWE